MLTPRSVVHSLKVLWVLVIIWYEIGIFVQSVRHCHWPDERVPNTLANTSRIMLVADPQILDHRSYDDRGPLLMFLTQKIVDLNLRKSWHAALKKQPDEIVFLGDMMDGGRWNISDDEYEAYYQRFKSIFKTPPSIPVHFTPGNHDIPLHDSDQFSHKAVDRYTSHFGPLNSQFNAAGHRIILLDGPGFVKEDDLRKNRNLGFDSWDPLPRRTVEYVRSSSHSPSEPTVLITHIPLSRSGFACGPLREKGHIRPGIGFGYQNTLGKEATEFVLTKLQPKVVFSGDDHDYCEHYHSLATGKSAGRKIREVSLKSLSMAMGIKRPGFQLLSLTSAEGDEDTPTHEDTPCFLPDQIRIYLAVYIPLFCFSILIIVLSNAFLPSKCRFSARDNQREGFLEKLLKGRISEHHDLPLHTPKKPAFRHRPWLSRISTLQSRIKMGLLQADHDHGYGRPSPSKPGLLRRVLRDVIDVAVYPCIIFAVLCWWYIR